MFQPQRLRALRKEKKLSQEELARLVDSTKPTISNYENEHSTPPTEMLVKLAKKLNTTTDYLLGITDNPNPPNDKLSKHEIAELRRIANDSNIKLMVDGKCLDPEDEKLARNLIRAIVDRASGNNDIKKDE